MEGVLRAIELSSEIIDWIVDFTYTAEMYTSTIAQAFSDGLTEMFAKQEMKEQLDQTILAVQELNNELQSMEVLPQVGNEIAQLQQGIQHASVMPQTFSEVWKLFEKQMCTSFQPIINMLNSIAYSDAFVVALGQIALFVSKVTSGLSIILWLGLQVFEALSTVVGYLAEKWALIAPLIYAVVGALGVYYGGLLLLKAQEMICTMIKGMMAIAQYAYAFAMQKTATAAAQAAAEQAKLNTTILASPIAWILVLIIAGIALLNLVIAHINEIAKTSISTTGVIMGAFAVLVAFIMNVFLIPVQNMFAAFANFLGNFMNNPIAAIKILFLDMCLTVVGYIQNLARAIETLVNKIPGINIDITGGLDRFYSQLEQAQQAVKDESGWVEYVKKMDFIDYGTAYDTGYSFGKDLMANFDSSSLFGTNDIPFTDMLNIEKIGNGIEGIEGNTGTMAEAMGVSGEELKYLRDIAEQDAINRFTTAEIHLEQTNHNTIKNGMDLDGVVSRLDDMLGEATEIMTEGVHV